MLREFAKFIGMKVVPTNEQVEQAELRNKQLNLDLLTHRIDLDTFLAETTKLFPLLKLDLEKLEQMRKSS